MANLKLYPHGVTAGIPGKPSAAFGRKQKLAGWSKSSSKSLIRLLYSLDLSGVSGLVAFTGTVKKCPHTPDDWNRLREAFFMRLNRQGVAQIIWLTEWQARGVPHLHGIIILPEGTLEPSGIIAAWLKAAWMYGAEEQAQTATPIYDSEGWSEYMGKHSARGVDNYQRNSENIPAEWDGRTGRMWGIKGKGQWKIHDPLLLLMDDQSYFRLRRIFRNKVISELREKGKWKALTRCRHRLKSNDAFLSRVRGINQFADASEILSILAHLSTFDTARHRYE